MAEIGQPRLGVCYYPEHWPDSVWADDAQRMAELGLTYVRVGEFAWSRIEPEPGKLELDWLGEAIDCLHSKGLRVILGTPTATPPKWLVDSMPDMLPVAADGQVRNFGSRRHYCFSHEGYREECARIVTSLARAFGEHPGLAAWQIDNEYDCHNTTLSYSAASLKGFHDWLARKYQSPQELNRAWGNVFWSMEYRNFEEIELPNAAVTTANPAHWMDFRRFASEKVAEFNRVQTRIIRKHSPGRDIIHNFMGRTLAFDHFELCRDLDIAGWDSYPIGFLSDRASRPPEFRQKFLRAGDPDFQAFHHDLYRATGRGRWWVMEQQPGPVNWAPYNPDPAPGMVRLWTWEAFAHGAEVVSYFRWRQAPYAQEQMHAGLLTPDSEHAPAHEEAAKVAEEIKRLGSLAPPRQAHVAILFDYPSAWAWEIQPHGADFDYFRLIYRFYCGFRAMGLDVDFLHAADPSSLGGYSLIVVPGLFAWPPKLREQLEKMACPVLIGPRTGSKTADFRIPDSMPPGLAGVRVTRVETFPETERIALASGSGTIECWREQLECSDGWQTRLESQDGSPILVRRGALHYLAGWPDERACIEILRELAVQSGLETLDLPPAVRFRRRGEFAFAVNYGSGTVDLRPFVGEVDCVIGALDLEPASVTVCRIA